MGKMESEVKKGKVMRSEKNCMENHMFTFHYHITGSSSLQNIASKATKFFNSFRFYYIRFH